jgi:hypothetical protein
MTRRPEAGVTLMELIISIAMLSLLSLGMAIAMHVGLDAFTRTDGRLMLNRRVAGAQRIVEQEIAGMIPVEVPCGRVGMRIAFFQGEARTLRLVSNFSLQQAWRGTPLILEMFVVPGENGRGVRLVVNELPYTGPAAGQLCVNVVPEPSSGMIVPRFVPVEAGPNSFVLADKLRECHFSYQWPAPDASKLPFWRDIWAKPGWPLALRIDMVPLDPDPSRLQPITVVVPIALRRSMETQYADN